MLVPGLFDGEHGFRLGAQAEGTLLVHEERFSGVLVPFVRRMLETSTRAGFEAMNQMTYQEARKLVTHPVACIDCHDPNTMQLRVTRPGFLEGIQKVKVAQGIANYDVNRDATRQEMRAYVCGQCHVEYYFKGPGKRVTYPWANGLKAEQIEEYYDKEDFADWTHKETGAKVLKAQHPEFEMWSQGIHARSGVACATPNGRTSSAWAWTTAWISGRAS